jgi:hypothetical protein
MNRTRDLLACSILPQPTTLPRAPVDSSMWNEIYHLSCLGISTLDKNFNNKCNKREKTSILRKACNKLPDKFIFSFEAQGDI